MPARRPTSLLIVLVLVTGCAIRAPVATPHAETTPRPAPTPTPVSSDGPSPTPPAESASAAPGPDEAQMGLLVTTCPGGVVLDWSSTTHPDFHHYTALRSMERDIAPNYPPVAPAQDWGDTYGTDRFATDAVDASILPSDTLWHYRVMAYDRDNLPVASTPVRTANMIDRTSLGSLDVGAAADGRVRLAWTPYLGRARCFTSYRVQAGTPGQALGTLQVISAQSRNTLETDALTPGATYELRVQAIRTTTLGSFVLGQTNTVTFTVP